MDIFSWYGKSRRSHNQKELRVSGTPISGFGLVCQVSQSSYHRLHPNISTNGLPFIKKAPIEGSTLATRAIPGEQKTNLIWINENK